MTIVQVLPKASGEVRRHVMELMAHRLKKGDSVIFITDVARADEVFKSQSGEDWFQDVRLINAPIEPGFHYSDFKNLFELFKYLKPIKPDVVHGHGFKGGVYARVLGRRRSVYSPHGGVLFAASHGFKKYFAQLTEKALLPVTGWVLVESRYCFKQFRKLISEGFARVSINYPGADFSSGFENKTSPGDYRVLAFAEQPHHGVGLLLRAASELDGELPDLKLQIFASGTEKKQLEDLAKGLAIRAPIQWCSENTVSPEEASKNASVVVVPSMFESFGIDALRAMAHSTPVIVAFTGGLMELVEHGETGRIFTRGSSGDLAEMLRVAFKNWNTTVNFSQSAYEKTKGLYSKDQMFSGIDKVYQSVSK